MPELHTLLKVTLKTHPNLQAMLIGIQQYKPTWIMGAPSIVPLELDFPSSVLGLLGVPSAFITLFIYLMVKIYTKKHNFI